MRIRAALPGAIRCVPEVGDRIAIVDESGTIVAPPQPLPDSRELTWRIRTTERSSHTYYAIVGQRGQLLYIDGYDSGRLSRNCVFTFSFAPLPADVADWAVVIA